MKQVTKIVIASTLIAPMLAPVIQVKTLAADNSVVKLRFLETTDLHTNSMNYDYFKDAQDETIGLVKAATVIKQEQNVVGESNSFLFDNGDTLQGTPFGDYVKNQYDKGNKGKHPMYELMEYLGYDAVTLGNHEFNFGLDFLKSAMKASSGEIKFVNSNVLDAVTKKPIVSEFNTDGKDYQIIERQVKDQNGQMKTVKVGVFGVVTPQIMAWDAGNLTGKVTAEDIVPVAKATAKKLKDAGADVVVALAHTGIGDTADQKDGDENVGYALTKIADIDVLMTGHQHGKFPDAKSSFNGLPNVDAANGLINGKPVVMANTQGKNVGVIDLQLKQDGDKWVVDTSAAKLADVTKDTTADAGAVKLIEKAHEGTLAYIRQQVGTINDDIQSFFALVQDDDSVQFVTNAQKWYVEKQLKENADLAQYKDLPLLSAGAPFKTGGRNQVNASDYTLIKKGPIALKNVADLYVYPNTLEVVKVKGSDVKNWLEMSAGQFNEVTDAKTDLLNKEFRSYNFDILDGLTYDIDITKPAKYDFNGVVVKEDANRVQNIKYQGKEITDEQEFLVATNNYRAGSASFPGLGGGKNIVYKSAYETRNVISDFIKAKQPVDYQADNNWSLVASKPITVDFDSAEAAADYTKRYEGITNTGVKRVGETGTFLKFKLDVPMKDFNVSVSAVKPGAKLVTGTAVAGAKVTVKNGTTVLGTATADETGKYSVTVRPVKLRDKLTVVSELGFMKKETTVTVGTGVVATPAIDKKSAVYGSTVVTGKATEGLDVTLYKGSTKIAKAKTTASGFKIPVKNGLMTGTYTVKSTDISNKITKKASFTIKNTYPVKAWTGKKTLTGKVEKRQIVRLFEKTSNGYKLIAQDVADNHGNYVLKMRTGLATGSYKMNIYTASDRLDQSRYFITKK
ncbi:bifunctional metallophosphatase/5'-nucleotidase [Exiguobacterium sp. KRL4]|uniref:bifunctional 2',3'-cyclic-nucleotide 2'-phosphodiesterase/3'-nucleotidase n=1 Tax=Exiguobacterium sp. KRL4 TaxID=1914536 RepID=UPI0008F7EFBC|nr:bifunctional 2',3'-cyclic-nucleotide 2'-phosphodiesterase/3'-nucleotidase [Exiguobacterium sp. KRL4]OIN66966.1 bifunctional metallophosphatase/5'-nucleotidase [Exiguobacterium sp. KRL4]